MKTSPQIFRIVFEDADLMVIEKLKAFLSQRGDQSEGEGLFEFISRTVKAKIFPVHRLDREVLGLMVFGKTRRAAENLSKQFKERTVIKKYEAEVYGRVREDHGELVHYLKKNSKNNHVTVFPRPTFGAKRAELSFEVLERLETSSRLLISLKTGRSHQIRVQLAKLGHPIVGDSRYAKKPGDTSRLIQLRSVYLAVAHPGTKERLEWRLPVKGIGWETI